MNPRIVHRLFVIGLTVVLCAAGGVASGEAETPIVPDGELHPASTPAFVPLAGIQAIAAGGYHTCALTSSGGVKCWGDDHAGQVGDGPDNTDKLTPVDASGLTGGAQSIAAGEAHSCALTIGGDVKCWGADGNGQVGDGSADNNSKNAPVDVFGLTSVTAIAAGGYHTCALTSSGGVKCWGDDGSGQVGDGSADNTDKPAPVNVSGLTSVTAIAAGVYHTCALTSSGGVKCWGQDAYGQVGDGDDGGDDESAPVDVSGLTSVTAIAAGYYHTCALIDSGGVKCWGYDVDGQVGDGDADNNPKYAPVDVSGLTSGVTAIAAGGYHTCALTTGGSVKCWGWDDDGQVGDGAGSADKYAPVDVSGLTGGVQSIAAGRAHSCALTTDGGVKCWGLDDEGQIGDGALETDKLVPVDVLVPATCYQLTRAKSGGGAVPVAAFAQSPGCPLDHYLTGTQIILQAAPGPDRRVQSWSPPVAGVAGDAIGLLTMPAADTTVTVTYAPCRTLSLSHSGAGSDPIASPPNSPGCSIGRYAAGESIMLSALPGTDRRVQEWTGASTTPSTGSQVNSLTMPAADTTVTVIYAPCRTLSLSHSGAGRDPLASPPNSLGCGADRYARGESIVFNAVPDPDQRVRAWSGTSATPATGSQVNSLTMPNAAATVSVEYEACFTLSTRISGSGDPLIVAPATSYGCLTGGFAAGQSITLLAGPSPGWTVDAWSGTSDDDSSAATNSVTMPDGDHTVGVTYMKLEETESLYLPALQR